VDIQSVLFGVAEGFASARGAWLFPELDCHSGAAKLKQRFFRIATQMQDDTVFVDHGYSAGTTSQNESGFARPL
jgi:hypothetical protein